MRTRFLLAAPAIVPLMLVAQASEAQVTYVSTELPRFAIEGRVGAAVPTDELAGLELKTGVALEANALYRVLPRFALYGGYGWNRMELENPTDNLENVQTMGFTYGVRFDQPIMNNGSSFWIRGGGTATEIRADDPGGNEFLDTDYGAGWEIGTGLNFALADGLWQITPGVRFQSLDRDLVLEPGGPAADGTLRYVTFGIGIQRGFW